MLESPIREATPHDKKQMAATLGQIVARAFVRPPRRARVRDRDGPCTTNRRRCYSVDGYRGSKAPGAKLAWSALVAAALARIAVGSGDPVGLTYFGGQQGARSLPLSGGREAFERVVGSLEAIDAGGDARADMGVIDRALGSMARGARRGSIVVVLSD